VIWNESDQLISYFTKFRIGFCIFESSQLLILFHSPVDIPPLALLPEQYPNKYHWDLLRKTGTAPNPRNEAQERHQAHRRQWSEAELPPVQLLFGIGSRFTKIGNEGRTFQKNQVVHPGIY
jgi:hypothetical protein